LSFLSPLSHSLLSPSYLQLGERLKVEDSGYRGHVKRGEKKREKTKREHLLSSSSQWGRAQPCQSHRQPAATISSTPSS